MKNFKKIIALVVLYVMTIMMLPLGTLKVSANENIPQYLEINDMYLRGVSQYKNKALVNYEKENKSIVSLFVNGKETIIKEFEVPQDGWGYVEIVNGKEETYVIQTIHKSVEDSTGWYETITTNKYYSFDYNTEKLNEINKEELRYDNSNYGKGFSMTLINNDEFENEILNKINEKYNTEYTLNTTENPEGNMYLSVYEVVIEGGKPFYEYSAIAYTDVKSEEYHGVIGNGFEISIEGYHNYMSNYDRNSGYYMILQNGYTENAILHLIDNGKSATQCKVNSDFSLYGLFVKDNKFYSRTYGDESIDQYEIKDGNLVKVNSIGMISALTSIPYDKDGNLWTITDENGKRYIAKIEETKIIKKYEIPVFDASEWGNLVQMYVYDENNIVVSSPQGQTVFIQNGKVEVPNTPSEGENSKPEDTTKPEHTTKPEDSTVVVKPSEDNKYEIESIKGNSVNTIAVNKDASKFEISITNIEAIKDGTGSLQVKAENNIVLNIPFSVINKDLLEGAKAVKLQYNVVNNSDITKNIKGLNKVFNFELIVEKENGNVSIHNFENGVAEVKITLTNEELNQLNRNKIAVFYYNETTKKFEIMETIVDGNNITFKTPHFSSFVIAEKDDINSDEITTTLPETGAPISSFTIVLFAVLLIALGITLNVKKGINKI